MDKKQGIQDLASAFAERNGCDIKSATTFLKTFFEVVEEYVTKDKLVKIKGLGTFKLISVSDRESVNVNTGERIVIAGHTKLTFTPDSSLKEVVNRPFADFETTIINDSTPLEAMERVPGEVAETETVNSHSDVEGEEEILSYSTDDLSVESESTPSDTEEDEVGDAVETPSQEPLQEVASEQDAIVPPSAHETEAAVNPDVTEERNASETKIIISGTPPSPHSSPNAENPMYPMSSEPLDTDDEPQDKYTLTWWHVLFVAVLMCLSYAAGHYRILDKLDINLYTEGDALPHREVVDESSAQNPQPAVPVAEEPVVEEPDSLEHQPDSVIEEKPEPVTEEDPAEIAKYFPQVPGGEYWIVGDAGRIHYMQVGETLYRIARKELGDHNLIKYLIVFNKFEDPNIIHTGDPIRIPKLVKKVQEKE